MTEQTNPSGAAGATKQTPAVRRAPPPAPKVATPPDTDTAAEIERKATARARLAALDNAAKENIPGHRPEDPKFYSIDEVPVKVDLPDGRTALVGPEPRNLMPAFWRAANAAGCGSTKLLSAKQMRDMAPPPATDQVQRRALIAKAIAGALDAEEGDPAYIGFFLPNGLINLDKLSEKVGFKVERSERDEMFRKVRAEIEADDEAGSQRTESDEAAQAGAR